MMNKTKIGSLIFTFIFLKLSILIINQPVLSNVNYSSIDSLNQYGFYFHYTLNNHRADFRELEGVPTCCPNFETGFGTGISAGVFFELPFPSFLRIGLRAGISTLSAELQKTEPIPVIVNSEIVDGSFEHILKSTLLEAGVSPYLILRIYGGWTVSFGGYAGYLLKKDFEYVERLVEPKDRGVFIDTGTRERNVQSGEIPNAAQIYSAISFGTAYDLPLNETNNLMLSPEINVLIGMTQLAVEKNWFANSIRFGLSFRYAPLPASKPIIRKPLIEFYIDTLIVEVPNPPKPRYAIGKERIEVLERKVSDTLFIIENVFRTDTIYARIKPIAKIDVKTDKIEIKTRYVTEAFPVLPIIFFERESGDIPRVYIENNSSDEFRIDELEIKPIVFHNNVLNIIGERLKNNPRAILTLTGYADSTTERSNCDLALKRAENVKDYFVNILKIQDKRIRIISSKSKCSPANPTLTPNDSGFSENRRVEMSSDNPKILEPIIRENFLEIESISPDKLTFNSRETSDFAVKREIVFKQFGKTIFSKAVNEVKDIQIPIDERLAKSMLNGPLQVEFYIEDPDGVTAMDIKSINVRKDTNEFSIERLSLVLFDVGSDKLTPAAINSLKTFVKGLKSGSKVKITGYTDELGLKENNIQLSLNRARNTADVIKEHQPEAEIIGVDGVASSNMPFGIDAYDTPPKRFLSRTVQIENLKIIK